MLIGIDFGDNVFTTTVRAFLRLFVDSAMLERYPQSITKEHIIKVWNLCVGGVYLVSQNGFRYLNGAESIDVHIANTVKYLQLKQRHVYLGNECTERFIKDNNGEFNYIDTDTGEVYTS